MSSGFTYFLKNQFCDHISIYFIGKLEIKGKYEKRKAQKEFNGQATIVSIWGTFPSSLFLCIFLHK